MRILKSAIRLLLERGALPGIACSVAAGLSTTAAAEKHPRGSYQAMDYGPVIGETIVAEWPEGNISPKGLAVRLDHDAAMIFDTDLMRWSTASIDGWIDLSRTSHTSYKGSAPAAVEGRQVFATSPVPGWARDGSFDDPREEGRGNLPAEWARWGGFFRYGDRVALSYRVGDVEVLESPHAVRLGDAVVFIRAIRTSGSSKPMVANVAEAPPEAEQFGFRHGSVFVRSDEKTLVFRVESDLEGAALRLGENGRIELMLPPHDEPGEFYLFAWEETQDALTAAEVRAVAEEAAVDLVAMQQGGPVRWNEEVTTRVELAEAGGAYVRDRINLPFENPWGSWIRPAGFDFFEDGSRAALSTWNGDVWIVSGLDRMERVTWRRFASGLFYPMGIAIVNETVHVIEGGQLTRLHDLNGNGEADFYENVNNDGILQPMAHTLCLEVDSQGNFYFFKNGNRVRPTVPGHGALIRISADGSERKVFSTGIRGANTLAVGPDDMILGADQQGNWVPTARVDWLREGSYHGFVNHNPDGHPHGEFDPPVCWIPHRVDNSSGAMAHAGDERWGPMYGNWIIGSYGQATLLALLVEKKGDLMQGGVVQFPLKFESGLVRARVSPGDGQLYLIGLKGWQTTGSADGSFDRVRYTGLPNRLPVGLNVEPAGVRIRFSEALDPASIVAENFQVERWQYNYAGRYGSPEMSVANPGERGRDPVEVGDVNLLEDGKTVQVKIPDLKPVMQQAVAYRIRFLDGVAAENTVYHTIHRLSEDEELPVLTAGIPAEAALNEEADVEETKPADEAEGDWTLHAAGKDIFDNTCSACHQPAGQQGVAPALSESPWPGGDSEALIRILLHGKIGEQGMMMPFAWLSDGEIAELLSYIRVRWHDAEPIAEEEVQAVRAATPERSEPWTAEELRTQ